MKKAIYLLLLLAAVMAYACNSGFKVYKVKSGKHSSSHGFSTTYNKNSLDFDFKVNESWVWGPIVGISKVAGFSNGGHQENSIRLGFKNQGSALLVYAYCYVDGERYSAPLDTVEVGKTYTARLSIEDSRYTVRINNKEWQSPSGGKFPSWGYRLYPYVGGEYTLPDDWVVPIRWH